VFAKMGKLALTPDLAPKISQGPLNVNRASLEFEN
jgi:hypothetical protein